jgi:hypothetical protein
VQADVTLGWGAVLLPGALSSTSALETLRSRTAAGLKDAALNASVVAETNDTVRRCVGCEGGGRARGGR